MTAIAGFWAFDERPPARSCERILQGQSLYGDRRAQDDDGVLALGRNLFATLPEDEFDRGPQASAKFRLVADVRLDNRPQLIRDLGIESGASSRLCDAALLFEALLNWGAAAASRFVGEFAFAFWNGATRELLLGRDFLGLRRVIRRPRPPIRSPPARTARRRPAAKPAPTRAKAASQGPSR